MAELQERVETNPKTDYEHSDWHLGIVGLVLLGTFLFLVIAPFVLIAAFPRSSNDVSRASTVVMPQPTLQLNPPEDLARFMVDEDNLLNNYYWVDKDKGVVHIPVREAMKKVLAQGIPGFPQEQR